jgi:hypothetical protein
LGKIGVNIWNLNHPQRYIEILDQAKAMDLDWLVNANIENFGISYEKLVSFFKCLEN